MKSRPRPDRAPDPNKKAGPTPTLSDFKLNPSFLTNMSLFTI